MLQTQSTYGADLDLETADIDDLLALVVKVASRQYTPKLHGKGNTDFQLTRGAIGDFDVNVRITRVMHRNLLIGTLLYRRESYAHPSFIYCLETHDSDIMAITLIVPTEPIHITVPTAARFVLSCLTFVL